MNSLTASSTGLDLVAHHDLGGAGDGMQVIRHADALYVGHVGTSGTGTSILDVSDPLRPELVTQWPAPPRSHTHKVQVADGLLLVNHEKFPYRATYTDGFSAGLAVYTLTDPLRPEQAGFWPSGGRGVHRIVWTGGRYAHMSATPDGFRDRIWLVIDLAAPACPAEVARWWWPGQREDETPDWPDRQRRAAHHALISGDRAYLGYDDAGMVVLDVGDITRPRLAARAEWDGGSTHTCLPLPGSGLVVATDEQVRDGPDAPRRAIHVIDVAGTEPKVIAACPDRRASAGCRCDSARTTCTRTRPALTAADGSSSPPTSARVYASTTWPTPFIRSRLRTGYRSRPPDSRCRRSMTCSSTAMATSG